MAKGYWVISYRSVSKPDALAAYARLSAGAVEAAGGRILVRGPTAEVLEQGLMQRTVVVEFESLAAAKAAYESPAYTHALSVLDGGAERDFRLCESPS
jgi:uncharacterized protein (DUF1330 family)